MRTNGYGIPIVAVDIDGTMAAYHLWFLKFAELYLGKPMPHEQEATDGQPLHDLMGVTKEVYREVKLAYRQGGMKRSMPCLEGASSLIRRIRIELSAEVWICTTRPYLRLDNIDPDTREWLKRNDIGYDALLFDPADGDDKYRELHRQADGRVACALEDLPAQAMKALAFGVPVVLLRNQPYNLKWNAPMGLRSRIKRWGDAQHAYEMVRTAVNEWRRGQDK